MSMRPSPIEPVPEETARIARAAFRKGNLLMRIRDDIGVLYDDQMFASAAWLSAANLNMKLCRRVVSSRKARSGRNAIPVAPGSKALCRRAFGASGCAAAAISDR